MNETAAPFTETVRGYRLALYGDWRHVRLMLAMAEGGLEQCLRANPVWLRSLRSLCPWLAEVWARRFAEEAEARRVATVAGDQPWSES